MRKLVIANTGTGNRGKSTSVKEVYKLVTSRYPENIQIIHPLESGDVKAIVEVQGILVGIESKGDPKSRIFDSLDDFQAAGCSIIVIACRTYGDTFDAVDGMHQCGYQVNWSTNPFTLKNTITEANKINHNIRPLIRVMKYWNVLNGKPYASYELEQKIANMPFWYSKNLEECFYLFVEALIPEYSMSQLKKNAVNKLKNAARQAQYYKHMGWDGLAENEIQTLFK